MKTMGEESSRRKRTVRGSFAGRYSAWRGRWARKAACAFVVAGSVFTCDLAEHRRGTAVGVWERRRPQSRSPSSRFGALRGRVDEELDRAQLNLPRRLAALKIIHHQNSPRNSSLRRISGSRSVSVKERKRFLPPVPLYGSTVWGPWLSLTAPGSEGTPAAQRRTRGIGG